MRSSILAQPSSRSSRLFWVEWIKGFALILIFVNHIAERLFSYPYIANPTHVWPPLAERISQLAPLTGFGLAGIPINLLRYLGWLGDQGVQLFIIVSGFGLVYGLLQKGETSIPLLAFYRRRLARIYPQWWVAHGLFMLVWLFTGWGLSLFSPATYVSFIGLRIIPGAFYYFVAAWWYFWLLLQLYLAFPFLFRLLQRIGPTKFLIGCCLVGFAAHAVGLLVLWGNWVDLWHRGVFFITRLPEFAFGMCFAVWLFQDGVRVIELLRRPLVRIVAALAYLIGLACALTLLGNTVALFVLGVSLFILLSGLLQSDRQAALLERIGDHSYSLYLAYDPGVQVFVPTSIEAGAFPLVAGIVAAIAATVVLALLIERIAAWVQRMAHRLIGSRRLQDLVLPLAVRAGALLVALYALLLGGEMLTRQLAPQEVAGWGERPSLELSDDFGWRLKPNQTTHLRWEHYDYVVTANALGFPGKDYPEPKPAGIRRILVTGDAFSSAEGVNTEQAWPRVLEDALNQAGQKTEVLNFAMTGYGPNQYAAVIAQFAPRYKPDVIVVEMFVNDYGDVLLDNDWFRSNIGFQNAAPNSARNILTLSNLRRWRELAVEPLSELFTGQPRNQGYYLGNFAAFEKDNPNRNEARAKTGEQLAHIKAVADKQGAKVFIVMVPASIQACQPNQLPYFPRNINLADGQFDLDWPQRTTSQLAQSLGLQFIDLRETLQSSKLKSCIYQPENMHWISEGHQIVATYLAQNLR